MGSGKTVVIGLNWVGDNVLALPAYVALSRHFHGRGGLAIAAPRNISTLLSATGLFDQVVPWERSMVQRIRSLRRIGFERAIILPNSFRSALVARLGGARERWGYAVNGRELLLNRPVERLIPRTHQTADYSGLLDRMGVDPVDTLPSISLGLDVLHRAKRKLRELGIAPGVPIVGIHPGGYYGPAKHWGDANFASLARKLAAAGNAVVVLTSPAEHAQAERIAASAVGAATIGQDDDVLGLAAVIAHCSIVVTNDSGPLHLAAALDVPTVSIFGPTDPERTVIAGASRVLRSPSVCQPCYQRECPLGHHRCMSEIPVEKVLAFAQESLEEVRAPARVASS